MPPNDAGVTMGHLHLNSADVEANKKIFVGMGGTAIKMEGAPLQYVRFPGAIVILNLPGGAPPSSGPTEGTVINHVGFLVPNVPIIVSAGQNGWLAMRAPKRLGR